MKKFLLGLIFALIFLSGCGGDGLKISDAEEFKVAGYRITAESAKIEDGDLILTAEWSFGYDEDSMDQEKFAATGIIVLATQNGEYLEEGSKDSGMYKDVYETSTSSIYPSFKLLNEKDPVEIIFNNERLEESKTITITLPQ